MTDPRSWAQQRLGITVLPAGSATGLSAPDLVGVALRRNPRRAHLLVSLVLGKHVPTDPRVVRGAGRLLGLLAVRLLNDGPELGLTRAARLLQQSLADPAAAAGLDEALDRSTAQAPDVGEPVVLGMCETAVVLGHAAAEAIPGARYLHSTRRPTDVDVLGGFEEEHSHATSHLLAPRDQALLLDTDGGRRPLIVVDDELSTGRTLLNTVEALHALAPRDRYVVLTLVDMRSHQDAQLVRALEQRTGARVDVVALAKGRVRLPDGLTDTAADLLAGLPPEQPAEPGQGTVRRLRAVVPGPVGGRHGIDAAQRDALATAMTQAAGTVDAGPQERVLVLGTEEFMAAPLLLGCALSAAPGRTVRYSTTTRSPAAAVDDDGYPLRTALTFAAPALDDDPELPVRYAYNVRGGAWDRIVLVVDEAQDGPRLTDGDPQAGLPSLVDLLTGCAPHVDVLTVEENL